MFSAELSALGSLHQSDVKEDVYGGPQVHGLIHDSTVNMVSPVELSGFMSVSKSCKKNGLQLLCSCLRPYTCFNGEGISKLPAVFRPGISSSATSRPAACRTN